MSEKLHLPNKTEMEASVSVPLDDLAAKVRPGHVPENAEVVRYVTHSIEGGTQREPYLSGVKFVWRWLVDRDG